MPNASRARHPALVGALAIGLVGAWMMSGGLYIKAKAELAQHLLERAWHTTLSDGGGQVKPWPWADMWPAFRITAERQGKSLIALEGASGEALSFGPGWLQSTPRPGQPGLSIIAAHRDTHFAFLEDIALGDIITITTADGARHRFEIEATQIVDANTSGLDPHTPGTGLALVTCYPFSSNQHGPLRFVAIGRLTEA
jgi:sortase A